ncbi:MAG TPA: cyclic nucleotide-binding domain-containing protein [Acidobacteriaceae bacterium]
MQPEPLNLLIALEVQALPVLAPPGKPLFQAGEAGVGVYIVHHGSIALSRPEGGVLRPVGTRGPNTIVGLPALLNGVHTFNGEAAELSELGYIARENALRLLQCYPRLRLEAMKLMAREFAQLFSDAGNDSPRRTHDGDR